MSTLQLEAMLRRLEDVDRRAKAEIEKEGDDLRWLRAQSILSAHVEMTIDTLSLILGCYRVPEEDMEDVHESRQQTLPVR